MESVIRVVVVGGAGVGKTALVSQLLMKSFPYRHIPTTAKQSYQPCVLVNDRIFHFHLSDLPGIRRLPRDSMEEWDTAPGWGLRSAHAYILVFDLSDLHSFEVVSRIQGQLEEMEPEPVAVVVGTKADLLQDADSTKEVEREVRKQWKRPYLEVSSKYNCGVSVIFHHLLCQLDRDIKKSAMPTLIQSQRRTSSASNMSHHCVLS